MDHSLNPAAIIARKRDGHSLTPGEIAGFVGGFARGEVPDYQMAALAMAIYLRGMDASETAALTECMLRSGTTLGWTAGGPPKVDKHSTGGVGDKVSLVLAPLLACCGLQVPMISGRGLGATGGTLDKLEAIPGFRTDLSIDEIRDITERVGCVITGATADIAPADKRLYALRDVTATVASIPLITASIMSKKLAENLDALVLDVKFGSGAFMKSIDQARELARSLVDTGKRMGVKTAALLTDMNQPLGRLAGNAMEVDESVATLAGDGPQDLTQLTLALGRELLLLTGVSETAEAAEQMLTDHIASGRALEKLREMVAAQGGDLDAPRPIASSSEFSADRSGFVASIDTEKLGLAVIELGGGRRVMTDRIDCAVGLEMQVRIGDEVELGDSLMRVFARPDGAERVQSLLRDAIVISNSPPAPWPLIAARVT
jgi:pyrimidine-nucleoside phosphorylase